MASAGIGAMKIKILFSACLFFCSTVSGQKGKVRNITVYHSVLQNYLLKNPHLKFIRFNRFAEDNIEIYPDTSLTGGKNIPYENRYDLGYLGHRYLAEKKFGVFPSQELIMLLDSLTDKKAEQHSFEGVITAKSLRIAITSYYLQKGEDRIFSKVPNNAQYPGGEKALTKHIQNRLAEKRNFTTQTGDSVVLLKMIVRKSGVVDQVDFIDSSNVEINALIRQALINSEKWTPALQGGREVHSYVEMFIRFRKDGSIEADYLY